MYIPSLITQTTVKVRPGVFLKMDKAVKAGSVPHTPNKMRKSDYLQMLEQRRNDKGRTYRPSIVDKITEETGGRESNGEAGNTLAKQLKEYLEANKVIG